MDPQFGQSLGDRRRDRRPAQASSLHVSQMFNSAVGMIQHAGEEVERAAPDRKTVGLH